MRKYGLATLCLALCGLSAGQAAPPKYAGIASTPVEVLAKQVHVLPSGSGPQAGVWVSTQAIVTKPPKKKSKEVQDENWRADGAWLVAETTTTGGKPKVTIHWQDYAGDTPVILDKTRFQFPGYAEKDTVAARADVSQNCADGFRETDPDFNFVRVYGRNCYNRVSYALPITIATLEALAKRVADAPDQAMTLSLSSSAVPDARIARQFRFFPSEAAALLKRIEEQAAVAGEKGAVSVGAK